MPATGQFPRSELGRFEVRGFDFAADGGWRRKAALVMAQRRALLLSGAFAQLNAPGSAAPAIRGNLLVPVVPIAFRDVSAPYASSRYQDLFFSPNPVGRAWSVKTFYAAESRGNLNVDGTVFGWVTVDSTAAYYEDGCNGIGIVMACPVRPRSRMADLLLAALDSISNGPGGDTVWSRFDNDGPDGIPNSGDDDGVVDVIAFLQPVVDGACGGAGIWSHRATIGTWNNGQPYVTKTPRRGANGSPIPGQFITINSYTIQSALGGDAACSATDIMPIGTVAHETGHAFGLPDLYDTSPLSGTQGIGEWGLMGAGPYARPYSPASFDAWSLVQLGWVAIDTLANGVTTTAPPVQLSNTVYYGGTAVPGFYFLLENRGAVGTDTAMMNPAFVHAKVPGLLVWQIDETRIAQGLPTNEVNTGTRQGVSLVQADDLDQLRTPFGGNRGDGGDPYPGNTANHDFGLATAPTALSWDLSPLNMRLDRINGPVGGAVTFRYLRRSPTLVASLSPFARIVANGLATTAYTEVIAPGDTITVSADTLQLSFDGRSAARFVAWSDGGARSHTIVARSGAPDTLRASFTTTNRLRIVVSGPGTVTASAAGAVGAGTFLDPSVVAHLVAQPAAGAEFVGWRGDTTTNNATVDIGMSTPRDLSAQFIESVTVDGAAAVRALLGGAALSAATSAYLDAIGNQNGTFDLGDYLAWLRRTGQSVPLSLSRVAPVKQ